MTLLFKIVFALICSQFSLVFSWNTSNHLNYPHPKRIDKTWTFQSAKHRMVIFDNPYFWMENATGEAKEVQTFVDQQKDLLEDYIKDCKDVDLIRQSLYKSTVYNNYAYLGTVGGINSSFTLYRLTKPGEQRPTWYKVENDEFEKAKKSNFNSPPGKPFLNESLLSSNDESTIETVLISPNGKLVCYLTHDSGTEYGTWYFRDISNPLTKAKTRPLGGEGRLNISIPSGDGPLYWFQNSTAFFYAQSGDTEGGTDFNLGYKIKFHQWGKEYQDDITVFDSADIGEEGPYTWLFAETSPDDRWLIVHAYVDTDQKMKVFATLLEGQTVSNKMNWISISPSYDYQVWPITIIDDYFYFQTDLNAINGKISKVFLDWKQSKQITKFTELQDRAKVIDVIAERKDATILAQDGVGVGAIDHDKVLVVYTENPQNVVYCYDLKDGKLIQKLFQDQYLFFRQMVGDSESNKIQISFSSWNTPLKDYEIEFINGQLQTSVVTIQTIPGINIKDFSIEELYAISKDGTKIPYFITYRKGTVRDGSRPAWIHVYGAYSNVESFMYNPEYFTWLYLYGGYFVWGVVRGGGDLGGEWHLAAEGINKQKSFDDLLAIAQDLVKHKITSNGKIIIQGDSAGGLAGLVVANQAPEGLIGAIIAGRPVCDMFMLELRSQIGQPNEIEFGNVSDPIGFDAVFDWSPLQNIVKDREYPAIIITAGAQDSKIPIANSLKCIAQFQYDNPNNKLPLLIYVSGGTGHQNRFRSLSTVILESTHQFCVSELALGLEKSSI